ncbi:late embryogenesis abundant protein D-34-like [Prunus yedoensis var. nudiflora]|uniref:Late embryogenesis abundant protein D-34-like n=1 Tax=Prunus yedoensis var. nudiflora TaxID=2094558 RepID=A0A314ZA46_PRUYE|nr:late embryogenesis abundant protein D-34-like [Prunus yedoensis var. nudiflora]
MSQEQPRKQQPDQSHGQEPVKYGDVFNVSRELASRPAAENLVLGETLRGGPAVVMQSTATYNERARLVGHRDATEEGVSITERNNPDGNRVVTKKVGGQVVAQYVEPSLPMGSPGGALDRDAITNGEALEATALSAGDKPIDKSDAAAIQASEMKATGRTEIAPGGVATMAQYAASINPRYVNNTKLGDVLEDATQKLPADKVVTREDAKAVIGAEIRNSPTMSTTRGGVAESLAAASRINQNTGE